MARNSLRPETSVTQTTELNLTARALTMLKARVEEHAQLSKQEKEIKARKKRIEGEVDTLFVQEGQGEALFDGATIDGYRVKTVCGQSKRTDWAALGREFGFDASDIERFTTTTDNTPYVRITPPGGKDRDE